MCLFLKKGKKALAKNKLWDREVTVSQSTDNMDTAKGRCLVQRSELTVSCWSVSSKASIRAGCRAVLCHHHHSTAQPRRSYMSSTLHL